MLSFDAASIAGERPHKFLNLCIGILYFLNYNLRDIETKQFKIL